MAKVPRPGRVKTRLCPPLSLGAAASLYACLLSDTLSEMGNLAGARRYLFLDRHTSPGYLRGVSSRRFERQQQTGADLGERMARAALSVFLRGAGTAVIVGADCPSLSAQTVRLAFRELHAGADAVFCPTSDGGFCLAGLAAPEVRVFRGIAWSTPAVLSEVCGRCRALGMPYALLPPERDVDTWEDLAALKRWLASHRAPACPRTRAWLTACRPLEDAATPFRRNRTGSLLRGPRSRHGG